jgi:fucose 4-O-acetylase-like acetyltransferase
MRIDRGDIQRVNDSALKSRSPGIDAIKGILILAVLIGHNEACSVHAPWLRQLLYYFHTQCFLFLACALDSAPFSAALVRDRAVRYLVPYGMFGALATILSRSLASGAIKPAESWGTFGIALLSGDEGLLRDAIGMRVFWFLPTLYTLVMFRAVASTSSMAGWLVMAASIAWMAAAGSIPSEAYRAVPLGLPVAFFFAASGLVAREIFRDERNSGGREFLRAILAPIAAVGIGSLVVAMPLGSVNASQISTYYGAGLMTFMAGVLFPLAMFTMLMHQRDRFAGCDWLALIGRHSLAIYLVHMFVYRGATRLFFGSRFTDMHAVGGNLPLGLAILAVTGVVSLAVAIGIDRWPALRRIVFPRDCADWKKALGWNP